MWGPELDQQVVQVLPLLTNRFRIQEGVSIDPNGDPLKALGLDGLECQGNPLDV